MRVGTRGDQYEAECQALLGRGDLDRGNDSAISGVVLRASHVDCGLREIVASVEQAEAFMTKICGASEVQSTGIGQINAAIGAMDVITQENSALVEQTSAAAENLKQQASTLRSALSLFEVHGQQDAVNV